MNKIIFNVKLSKDYMSTGENNIPAREREKRLDVHLCLSKSSFVRFKINTVSCFSMQI